MGRLQYNNRKIEGVKLGQVVAKDLRKRIPPGLGSKAAQRDPILELDITNKGINDEAVTEICDALVTSIKSEAKTTILEELKLRENTLTAKSLRPLARVVRAAASDLRDLDLGYNAISIVTDEDAQAWEEFLLAFKRCVVLRRLDFSGNNLELKAFERLQKVYLGEDLLGNSLDVSTDTGPVNSAAVANVAKTIDETTLDDVSEESETEPSTPLLSRARQPSLVASDRPTAISPAVTATYSSTAGLRSVPYICLFRTTLTDHCALYLSYVVEQHSLVAELLPKVPPVKPGMPTTQIEAYDLIEGCNGILWKPNDELGKDGNKVLELAEQARINVAKDPDAEIEETVSVSLMAVPRKAADTPSPFTPIAHRNRRGSMSSSQGSPFPITPGAVRMNTLDAVRNRMQIDIIKDHGLRSNGLWHAAIKVLAFSRPLLATYKAQLPLPIEDASPAESVDDSPLSVSSTAVPDTPATPTPTPLKKSAENIASTPSPAENLWPRLPAFKVEASVPSKHTLVFRLNTNRQGQTSLERDQKLKLSVPSDKHGSTVVEVSEVGSTSTKSPTPKVSPKLPRKQYRTNLPMGLSEQVWCHIIGYAVDAGDAFSTSQQEKVIKYASDYRTLREEFMRLGKPKHAQIWKALEQMGCLTYA